VVDLVHIERRDIANYGFVRLPSVSSRFLRKIDWVGVGALREKIAPILRAEIGLGATCEAGLAELILHKNRARQTNKWLGHPCHYPDYSYSLTEI
jgi:hypothetical protein